MTAARIRGYSARALTALSMALLLAACAAATRPLEDPAIRTVDPIGSIALFDAAQRPIETVPAIRPGERLEILALSGGGADGAFGAGVLKGWSESGSRPRFDIVTGVSTGALMSLFAFLGPQYDNLLEDLYTRTNNSRIYRKKPLFAGLSSASMYDYTPLKHEIERLVDARLLRQVAREYKKGRRLYVATTNLDGGKLVVWDIGLIAASGHPARVRIIQKILRASAAVPGLFKPVYIQPLINNKARQMHVDGSVKAPFLLNDFMLAPKARQRDVYIIVNGQMKLADADRNVKPKTIDIARKSITELLRGMMEKTLFQAYVMSRKAKAGYHLLTIPDSAPPTKNPLDFNPRHMRELFEIGRRLGRDSHSWLPMPPRLGRLERI